MQTVLTVLLCSYLLYHCANASPQLGTLLWLSDLHIDPLYSCTYNRTTFCRPKSKQWQINERVETNPCKMSMQSLTEIYYGSDLDIRACYDEYFYGGRKTDTCAPFGRYGCNPPFRLVEELVKYFKTAELVPKAQAMIISGDFVGHHQRDADDVLTAMQNVTKYLQTHLDSSILKKVIPCFGNTDLPLDYYLPIENQTEASSWFAKIYEVWKPWLPTPEQEKTILKGGYYSTTLFNDKLRVIVINTGYYSISQWPRPTTTVFDPAGQFTWLENELAQAAQNNQGAYIVGHHVPSMNAYDDKPIWQDIYQQQFFAILEKYSNIVRAQFYSHIHKDTFRIVGNMPAYVSAALSPVFNSNPGFKEMYVALDDEEVPIFTVYDMRVHFLDLYNANRNNTAVFSTEYQWQSIYGQMNGMTTSNLKNLQFRLRYETALWNVYNSLVQVSWTLNRPKLDCEMDQLNLQDYIPCINATSPDGV